MESKWRIKLLHVVGSPTNEFSFSNCLLYARHCSPNSDDFHTLFAVLYPDRSWSFLSDFEEVSLEAAEKVDLAIAAARMIEWKPDVIHSHLQCDLGQSVYRGLLLALGFPLIGGSLQSYISCKNKGLTRGILQQNSDDDDLMAPGIIVHHWNQEVRLEEWKRSRMFPCVVKGANLEDSIGLAFVDRPEDLKRSVEECFKVAETVIIEKFIAGSEYRVGVIEKENSQLEMLPVLEYLIPHQQVRPLSDKISLDADGKVTGLSPTNTSEFVKFAPDSELKERLQKLTFKAFYLMELRDFALFDIRADANNVPHLLEINLFCAFSEKSVLNRMAKEAGISDNQLLKIVSNHAIKRATNEGGK